MTSKFELEGVMKTLREVVAGKEDFVYTTEHEECIYAEDDGSPSCVVGHVIARLDPELLAKVAEGERFELESGEIAYNSDTVSGLFNAYGLPKGSGVVLRAAQKMQDAGVSWGEALELAEESYKMVVDND